MIARCKLAAINFNQGQILDQEAKTKAANCHYNYCFSKVTKTWVAKPVKEKKCLDVFTDLVDKTVAAVLEKREIEELQPLSIPPNIASKEKPSKEEILKGHRSKFGH